MSPGDAEPSGRSEANGGDRPGQSFSVDGAPRNDRWAVTYSALLADLRRKRRRWRVAADYEIRETLAYEIGIELERRGYRNVKEVQEDGEGEDFLVRYQLRNEGRPDVEALAVKEMEVFEIGPFDEMCPGQEFDESGLRLTDSIGDSRASSVNNSAAIRGSALSWDQVKYRMRHGSG